MPRKITKETENVLELNSKGFSNSSIQNKLGISIAKIRNILTRYGVKSNKWEPIDESIIKHLLIGSYLGDGHFTKIENHRNSRLHLGHSPDQKDYFLWKCEKLKKVSLFTGFQERNNMLITRTKPHPIFTKFRKEGYNKGINLDLVSDINEESFSIWYLDDGSVTTDGFSIACYLLSEDEKQGLKDIIYKNLKLDVNITSETLYIPKKEVNRFIEIVEPFCPESMKYKLKPYNTR